MQNQNLLIEIGSEELPPDGLFELGEAFATNLKTLCNEAGFSSERASSFATPRRIAARLETLTKMQADSLITRKGPLVEKAYDKDGNPLPPALGFAKSCGVEVSELQILEDEQRLYVQKTIKGQNIKDCISALLDQTLEQLPISKRMRWGEGDYEFIRPIHWVLALYGEMPLELELMGIRAGKQTYGHRYHYREPLTVPHADDYEMILEQQAKVIPSFHKRMQIVNSKVKAAAQAGKVQMDDKLQRQVASIVEWPVAISGHFDKSFLKLPPLVIRKILEKEQKCFTVLTENGTLTEEFIVVANIESTDPKALRHGYERVIEPRLKDAEFFINQDRKHPLRHYADSLDKLIFHQQLGSMADKVERIVRIAVAIAQHLRNTENSCDFEPIDAELIEKSARLCKADLKTSIVCEYPELASFIGGYYAESDGEPAVICQAIQQHIQPLRACDPLPEGAIAVVLAIADRLDALVGIFGIGEYPSGSRDPYALRRASLGLIRIITEYQLNLDLVEWVSKSQQSYAAKIDSNGIERLLEYLKERIKNYFTERGFSGDRMDAVSANRSLHCHDMHQRLIALQSFMQMPQSTELAAATKRIRNILKKNLDEKTKPVNPSAFSNDAEQLLYEALSVRSEKIKKLVKHRNYLEALKILAQLRESIDDFFDKVLVMSENEDEKNNRLALLYQIDCLFMQLVDFSKLQLEE